VRRDEFARRSKEDVSHAVFVAHWSSVSRSAERFLAHLCAAVNEHLRSAVWLLPMSSTRSS
jgi:hypothetical protein